MSRVTRSRKIAIAEDIPDDNSQVVLPNSEVNGSALNDISNDIGVNNMVSENVSLAASVPAHIKQLKAAYRNAISTKKNKKSKPKRKDGEDSQHVGVSREGVDTVNDENNVHSNMLNFDLPAPLQDTGLSTLLDTLSAKESASPHIDYETEQHSVKPDTTGLTRRQLAQQQAGQ